jgi:uncharacterized membrane protein YgdD (TMEM256/DUF423 family)
MARKGKAVASLAMALLGIGILWFCGAIPCLGIVGTEKIPVS